MSSFLSHELSNSSTCKDLIVISRLAIAMIKKFVIVQVLTQRIKSNNINKFYTAVKHTKPQTSMLLQNVYSKQQNFKVISN